MTRFHTLVTHRRPHLDEIFAIWLLRCFGDLIFPGISTAKLFFVDAGSLPPDGRTAEEWFNEGVLAVGVWGGLLDEHPTAQTERKEKECATTLAAAALGLDDAPSLERMIAEVRENDTKGSRSPLAEMVQTMHDSYPNREGEVMAWTWKYLDALQNKQDAFHSSATREAFERKTRIKIMDGPHHRPIRVAVIESDDRYVSGYARSKYGGRCDLTIRYESTGHFQIHTTKDSGIKLYDVIRLLRLAEYGLKSSEEKARVSHLNTRNLTIDDFRELEREGTIASVPELYFQESGQFILNGSLTARDVPPSKMSLAQIYQAVRIALSPDLFDDQRAENCRQGNCTSSLSDPCSWYRYGLKRCRSIRFSQHHGRQLPVYGQDLQESEESSPTTE